MTTIDRSTNDDIGVEHAAEFARHHPGLVKLGRVGWIAKGIVYTLTGFLALFIAFGSDSETSTPSSDGSPDQEASQSGAIAKIAESSGGVILLYVIAGGLVLYSLWRIVSALLPASSPRSTLDLAWLQVVADSATVTGRPRVGGSTGHGTATRKNKTGNAKCRNQGVPPASRSAQSVMTTAASDIVQLIRRQSGFATATRRAGRNTAAARNARLIVRPR